MFCNNLNLSASPECKSPYLQEAGKINSIISEELKKIYDIKTIGLGFGNGENSKIRHFYIRMQIGKIADVNEARKLSLSIVDHYLKGIRKNGEFLDKYVEKPFNESNFNIMIFIDHDENLVNEGVLSSIWVANQKITYRILKIVNDNEITTNSEETIEEARQKVK